LKKIVSKSVLVNYCVIRTLGERSGIRTLDLLIRSQSLEQTAGRLLSPTLTESGPSAIGPIQDFPNAPSE
jgi:hypothetical protein